MAVTKGESGAEGDMAGGSSHFPSAVNIAIPEAKHSRRHNLVLNEGRVEFYWGRYLMEDNRISRAGTQL